MRAPLAVLVIAVLLRPPLGEAATPLAGRWDGTFHGGRGDQPVTLICRPGASGTLDGLLYMGGDLMGRLEHGSVATDSLHFTVMNLAFRARRDGSQMAVEMSIPHGRTHAFELHFASADTASLVQSSAAAAAARARVTVPWDQVPDSVLTAHRVPSDAPVGVAAALRPGALLLVGGGPTQADLNAEFLRLAGGASAKIVVIPTATIDPGDDAGRLDPDAWARSLEVAHVTVLHTTSRTEADAEAFVRPLREATGVWLPGGEAGRILVSYLGTRTERELLAVLARGGVIGGTSAGALVWGSECQVFQAPADGSPFRMGDTSALRIGDPHSVCFGALRNVVVAPHFTEFHMEASLAKTLAARPQLLGVGIDEATAVEVRGDTARVLGRGRVTIGAGGSKTQTLEAGARYDLVRRTVL